MTSVAIERARAYGQLATQEDERRWGRLLAKANVYANGTMVPRDMQQKPDVVLAGMLLCQRLGFSEDSVTTMYVIEGHLDPPAQMYLGAAHRHGFDTKWLQTDNEAAVIKIRAYDDPDPDWLTVSFTIDDARRAGYLDEWVEHWTTYKDSRNQSRNKLEKFVLGREGVAIPDWAQDEIAAGKTKRMDNWHKWPADMLASKASKRAVRRMCPEVLFGAAEEIRAATGGVVTLSDEDIVDAEIVPASACGDDVDAGARAPGDAPGPASALERQLVKTLIGTLDDSQRDRLRRLAKTDGIPNVDGPAFTGEHAERLTELRQQVLGETETEASGSADVEEAGGTDPRPQTEAAPTHTYAPGEEPFA